MERRSPFVAILIFLTVALLIPLTAWSQASFPQPDQAGPSTFLPIVSKQIPPTPTPTLTPTPTPPATATPTLVPTQTPTTQPTPTEAPGVRILGNHSTYVDSINYLHIVGEVWNNTGNSLRFVEITANIFNSSGQLVGTDFTYAAMDNLQPGDKTCFQLLLPAPSGWSSFTFEPVQYWTDGDAATNLALSNVSGGIDGGLGWYSILGLVTNNHGNTVRFVQPVGTLYSNGQVIGCDFTFTNSTDLAPGQQSSFKLTFPHVGTNMSFRVQVDGSPE